MRSSILVGAIALSAALVGTPAAAQVGRENPPVVGGRELTELVLQLSERVASLEASNSTLQEELNELSEQLAVLVAADSPLAAILECVAPDSGPGRLVLRGCDLAVLRSADGAGPAGDVEIEGVLRLNEAAARTSATDPRSGTLRLDAPEELVLRSLDQVLVTNARAELLLSGQDALIQAPEDVLVRASSRIVLQAAMLVTP